MSFWMPVNTPDNIEKVHILGIARKELVKQLNKVEKDVQKKSDKLRQMDPFTDSQKKTRNARMNLDIACKERDTILRRINIIDEWREEIKRGG